MDDDLFSAFGASDEEDDLYRPVTSQPAAGSEPTEEDDLFAILGEEIRPEPAAPSVSRDADDRPEWVAAALADMEAQEEQPAARPAPRPRTPTFLDTGGPVGDLATPGLLFGLTPQQRLILAVFLLIDVAILGCLLLVGIGAIQF